MSHPKLVHPDQPLPLRLLLHVYQFAASLKLAVVMIFSLAITLGAGTVVEARYGTPVAQYHVYQTWWFNLVLILLAINIFCAASIRYPWKRYQTGFVITHIGLLTLLFGTALSRKFGIDAQMMVWEHSTQMYAMEETMHFRLYIHDDADASDAAVRKLSRNATSPDKNLHVIPYRPGPFSFRDFTPLSGLLCSISSQQYAGEVIYDDGHVKLEVRDYLSDSKRLRAPQVTVKVSAPRKESIDDDGKTVKSRFHWNTDTIQIVDVERGAHDFPFGVNATKGMFPGGTISFRMTDRPGQLKAFFATTPKGPLGEKGQVALWVDGKVVRIDVDEKYGDGPFRLEGTPYEAEVTKYWPNAQTGYNKETERVEAQAARGSDESVNPAVQVELTRDSQPAGRLLLLADQPGMSIQNYERDIYGDYWFDHAKKDRNQRMMHGIGNRIDILQTKNDKGEYQLHYRRWDKTSVVDSGELAAQGKPDIALDAFTMSDQLKFFVDEHIPADQPMEATLPVEFVKDRRIAAREPAVKIRLTVDGQPHEQWLIAAKTNPNFLPVDADAHPVVAGKQHKVSLVMPIDAVDIGFRVRLNDFDRRLDPGTSQPSHYSSTVNFLERNTDRKIMRLDPASGRVEQVNVPVLVDSDHTFHADRIALAQRGEKLFWIDRQTQSIYKVDLNEDPKFPKAVVTGRTGSFSTVPVDLAVDDDARRLYWIETTVSGQHSQVRSTDFDGEDESGVAFLEGRATGFALDAEEGVLIWSSRGVDPTTGKSMGFIGRAGLDGKNVNARLITTQRSPTALALDVDSRRIYWTEFGSNVIGHADYDGGRQKRIVLEKNQQPVSIAVDSANERLYWADMHEPLASSDAHETGKIKTERHRLWTSDLDGENLAVAASQRIDDPAGLIIDSRGQSVWWTQDAIYRHNVWITMNAPVEFSNPISGRSYRLFQESFNGPYIPGTREYETLVPKNVDAADLYASVLTVNYDPGRWIRNIGCLLIVLGIATMFYMRAYFFRPQRRTQQADHAQPPVRQTPPSTAIRSGRPGGTKGGKKNGADKTDRNPKAPAEVAR